MGERTLHKILNIALITALVGVLAGTVALFYAKSQHATDTLSPPVVGNVVMADYRARDGQLRYYNGNTIMSLSLGDFGHKKLIAQSMLLDVSSVHWLKDGAVINFSSMPQSPKLKQQLEAAAKDAESKKRSADLSRIQNLYWYLRFADSSITFVTYADDSLAFSRSSDGSTLFFTDTPSDASRLTFFSQITDDGTITRDIFAAPKSQKTRLIDRRDNVLYFLSAGDNAISLRSYDARLNKDEQIIEKVYDDTERTIYADAYLVGDSLVTTTNNPASNRLRIDKTSIHSKTRSTIREVTINTGVSYEFGSGSLALREIGTGVTSFSLVDVASGRSSGRVTVGSQYRLSSVVRSGSTTLIVNRPYILAATHSPISRIAPEQGIEKIFSSDASSLTRDIFSQSGDINSYAMIVARGSLKAEYEKLSQQLSASDLSINDFTIRPELGRQASPFDLD